MKVKIWGCRGSITTPGAGTLRYGGESTCLEITSGTGERIIVDCGSGIRRLGHHLLKEKSIRDVTILLTHAHWDHLAGFPFFVPAYVPDFRITVCGGPDARDAAMKYLKHQMEPPFFPVDFSAMKADFGTGCSCGSEECTHCPSKTDGSIQCCSIPLNHPNGGYGFRFTSSGKSFVFLSDNEIGYSHEGGRSREDYVEFRRGADLLFHDAQYTEKEYERTRSWGHSTFEDAIKLGIDAGAKRLGLFHHDPEHDDDMIDKLAEYCGDYIHKAGSSMECFACVEGMEIEV